MLPNMNIRDKIQWHAEAIAKDVPGIREHWLEIGALYLQIEREYLDAHPGMVAVNGRALGNARKEWREGDASPEAFGLRSPDVSNAVLLARHRPAVEVFFCHDKGNAADPTRLVKEWKRWAVEVRLAEGKGQFTPAVKEKYFPGISSRSFDHLFPPVKADPEVIRKIYGLAAKAEDREGTPEGDAFLEKAESMAEDLGLSLQQARDQYEPEPTPQEFQRTIIEIHRFILRFSSKYPVGLFRAAAMYMFDNGHGDPKKIERVLAQFNEEEC